MPVSQSADGAVTVEFKPFGVGLAFTPVVLSEGRIALKISTEVSELSSVGAFTVGGGTTGTPVLSIPSLSVRRAETSVEMPSGSALMIAGLLQERSKQSIDSVRPDERGLSGPAALRATSRAAKRAGDHRHPLLVSPTPRQAADAGRQACRSPRTWRHPVRPATNKATRPNAPPPPGPLRRPGAGRSTIRERQVNRLHRSTLLILGIGDPAVGLRLATRRRRGAGGGDVHHRHPHRALRHPGARDAGGGGDHGLRPRPVAAADRRPGRPGRALARWETRRRHRAMPSAGGEVAKTTAALVADALNRYGVPAEMTG